MRKLLCLLLFILTLTACPLFEDDEGNSPASVNVQGTWRAPVTIQSCVPATTCDDVGFEPGTFANAVMTLRQNGRDVEGEYTYEGSGIVADVSGEVAGNQLVLDGRASNPLGRVTVEFTGTVSNNVIQATVSHDISLTDGRTGSVSGTGNFTR